MNYFRINLNKLEDKSEKLKKLRLEGLGLILIMILFISVTYSTYRQFATLKGKKKSFLATQFELQDEIKSLEKDESYISEDNVQELYDLTSTRIFWTEKLEALSHIVDTSISITYVNFYHDKLYIRGITRALDKRNQFQTISTFIDSLKASPVFAEDFPRIEFSQSERIDFMNRNIISFEVVCLQNSEQ